jgi:hypothetical protein
MIGRFATALTIACAGLLGMACNTCPFGLVRRPGSTNPLRTVACCGAFAHVDVTVQDVDDLEIDLANTLFPGQTGRVDVWLTDTTCPALFDDTDPSGTPRCETLIGPVAPNTVSSRQKVRPGQYRVFVQAYSSNTSAQRYDFDVGVWGRTCRMSPAAPKRAS